MARAGKVAASAALAGWDWVETTGGLVGTAVPAGARRTCPVGKVFAACVAAGKGKGVGRLARAGAAAQPVRKPEKITTVVTINNVRRFNFLFSFNKLMTGFL